LLWEVVVKTPLLPLPSTATSIDDATIGTAGSIPLLLPSMTTAIAAVYDHHCRCHTVDDDNRPLFVIDCGNGNHR
jgi:hypothetical protein